MVHRHPVKVRFYELDPYNHLNHASYIQYFEVGRVELLESLGFSLATMKKRGFHLVVTAIETRFLASAGPHDELIIETRVARLRRATSMWRQRILRGDDVLAEQTVTAAMTNTNGKPVRFAPELAAALEPYLEP
ncbi:MAG: thioesterase family protein [Acidimicrobiia bacterium]|nr:thioesterase family protein [Acidimicrobiia bacterium]